MPPGEGAFAVDGLTVGAYLGRQVQPI